MPSSPDSASRPRPLLAPPCSQPPPVRRLPPLVSAQFGTSCVSSCSGSSSSSQYFRTFSDHLPTSPSYTSHPSTYAPPVPSSPSPPAHPSRPSMTALSSALPPLPVPAGSSPVRQTPAPSQITPELSVLSSTPGTKVLQSARPSKTPRRRNSSSPKLLSEKTSSSSSPSGSTATMLANRPTSSNQHHSHPHPRPHSHHSSHAAADHRDDSTHPINFPITPYDPATMLPPDSTARLGSPDSPFAIAKKRYATSVDERNFLTVYEYQINGCWIMWDYFSGYVHLTGLWKAIGNSKADIVKLVDNSPALLSVIRRVRGGYLKIQGTWLPFPVAYTLASRTCYHIRHALIPVFGHDFPQSCLTPNEPGFGQLQLTVSDSSRRRRKRSSGATAAAPGGSKSEANGNEHTTAPQEPALDDQPVAKRRVKTAATNLNRPSSSSSSSMMPFGQTVMPTSPTVQGSIVQANNNIALSHHPWPLSPPPSMTAHHRLQPISAFVGNNNYIPTNSNAPPPVYLSPNLSSATTSPYQSRFGESPSLGSSPSTSGPNTPGTTFYGSGMIPTIQQPLFSMKPANTLPVVPAIESTVPAIETPAQRSLVTSDRASGSGRVKLDFLEHSSLTSSPSDLLDALQATKSLQLLSAGVFFSQMASSSTTSELQAGVKARAIRRTTSDSGVDRTVHMSNYVSSSSLSGSPSSASESSSASSCSDTADWTGLVDIEEFECGEYLYRWDGKSELNVVPLSSLKADSEVNKTAPAKSEKTISIPRSSDHIYRDDGEGLLSFAQVVEAEMGRNPLASSSVPSASSAVVAASTGIARQSVVLPPLANVLKTATARNNVMDISGLLS
ncbi:uncharacterized protein V1516DRAFT_665499 [Lipomyces oligophaga]|uniref:uncharacterized protein n=1 Tax=Lipomyces oligophaga TaxID=45792 RepID=UPI0034CDB50B